VHVDCPVEEAFRLFTESFAEWWPGDGSEPAAVENGSVTLWDPPSRIEFTWSRDRDQTVNVEFQVEADGTRVTITHHGWQSAGVMSCASRFAHFVSQQALVAA
jgi:uncharacterized protein YndB with AHSA1/START domain